MADYMLQVKGLKTYYYTEEGVVPAVDGLDFEVAQGETFAIVGESGCGKSVTSLSILGLIPNPPGKNHCRRDPVQRRRPSQKDRKADARDSRE